MLLLLLGCANEATVNDTVDLEWRTEDAPCTDGTAEYTPPDDALMVAYRTDTTGQGDLRTRWNADVTAVEGTISLACEDDLTFVYAVVK